MTNRYTMRWSGWLACQYIYILHMYVRTVWLMLQQLDATQREAQSGRESTGWLWPGAWELNQQQQTFGRQSQESHHQLAGFNTWIGLAKSFLDGFMSADVTNTICVPWTLKPCHISVGLHAHWMRSFKDSKLSTNSTV